MANTNYPSSTTPAGKTPSNNNTRNVLIGILAAGLLGTWAYVLVSKNKETIVKTEMRNETTNAVSARDSVQTIYNEALSRLDSLVGSNNSISGQLSDRQIEITRLKTEINKIVNNKNATAADLSTARRLISNLNGKISNLEAEVARLMGENQQLATTNTVLTEEKATLQTDLQTTTTQKEELAQKVDIGSTFSANNFNIRGIDEKGNGKEKETDKAKKVNKLVVSFDIENRITQSGPTDLYVIVSGPDGQVISSASMGSGNLTTRADGDRAYTSKVSVEYEQGTRKNIQVPLRQEKFATGDYKIEVYQNGFKIAEGNRTLKKSGLFG